MVQHKAGAILAIAILAVFALRESAGLHCYSCVYFALNGTEVPGTGDTSCEYVTPDPKLLIECPDPEEAGFLFQCGMIVAEGGYQGSIGRLVTRGCIELPSDRETACEGQTHQEWQDQWWDVWAAYVAWGATGFNMDADVRGCHCMKDECNTKIGCSCMDLNVTIAGGIE